MKIPAVSLHIFSFFVQYNRRGKWSIVRYITLNLKKILVAGHGDQNHLELQG